MEYASSIPSSTLLRENAPVALMWSSVTSDASDGPTWRQDLCQLLLLVLVMDKMAICIFYRPTCRVRRFESVLCIVFSLSVWLVSLYGFPNCSSVVRHMPAHVYICSIHLEILLCRLNYKYGSIISIVTIIIITIIITIT